MFARPADLQADTAYVIGGLYGNRSALDRIATMAAVEPRPVARVFNGDFHWFDADPAWFAAINEEVAKHHALRGNVETEIAGDDADNGCGCAYPESVGDDDVARSNAILARLRETARSPNGVRRWLASLPMHAVAQVGGARVAIVHGDAWSLAGWRFAHDALHDPARERELAALFEQAAVDGFASSHTCLPALKVLATPLGERFVINNGAAGMPNFREPRCGVITRLATEPLPAPLQCERLYGAIIAGLFVDALAVRYDHEQAWREFSRIWPAGSDADVSYRRRLQSGPAHSIADALRPATACKAA